MKRKDLNAHLFGPGPKRILALDGGGIRGILTLHLLTRIEKLVRGRTGDDAAVLANYFDLIGGTSPVPSSPPRKAASVLIEDKHFGRGFDIE